MTMPTQDQLLHSSIKAFNNHKRKAKGKAKADMRDAMVRAIPDNMPAWLRRAIVLGVNARVIKPGKTYTFHNKETNEFVQGVGFMVNP